jgi:hypothetical protein
MGKAAVALVLERRSRVPEKPVGNPSHPRGAISISCIQMRNAKNANVASVALGMAIRMASVEDQRGSREYRFNRGDVAGTSAARSYGRLVLRRLRSPSEYERAEPILCRM